MIDLHCHLLPGIDDGPETLDEALDLARYAVQHGIRRAVVTPHIHPGRYDNELATISPVFEAFRSALVANNIPLELSFSAEVHVDPAILALVAEERLPFLGVVGDYRIILLEFPHGNIPVGSDKLVDWLLQRRIRPLIAHPERNKDVIRDWRKIAPFVSMGCWLQVTAGSVAGDFGPNARDTALTLLEQGWVRILASDAHNIEHRPPEMEEGRQAAGKVIGEAESWLLVRDNPAMISATHFPD
jgi:protein-tyrosine phosphatase